MSEIPQRKHGVEELDDLRRRNAFQVKPPIKQIKAQELHLVFVALFYVVMIASIVFTKKGMYLTGFPLAGVSMLASIWIFWKKPRSTHHAVIISIISLLVLVFGTVYYIEKFEQEAHEDTQGSIRY